MEMEPLLRRDEKPKSSRRWVTVALSVLSVSGESIVYIRLTNAGHGKFSCLVFQRSQLSASWSERSRTAQVSLQWMTS